MNQTRSRESRDFFLLEDFFFGGGTEQDFTIILFCFISNTLSLNLSRLSVRTRDDQNTSAPLNVAGGGFMF